MKFFKKPKPEKLLEAIVLDVLHFGTGKKTYAEDDAEQIKAANLQFLDATPVKWGENEDHTQSAFILDETIREVNHPLRRQQGDAGASNNISLQMPDDSDGESYPEMELPPDIDMSDPIMLEAIIAQREWERERRRSERSQTIEEDSDDEDEDEDYDFDSEYSSDREEEDDRSYTDDDDDDDDDRSYASRSVSVIDDDDASRSVIEDDENYSTHDDEDDSSFRQALGEAATDDEHDVETENYSDNELEDDNSHTGDEHDDDDDDNDNHDEDNSYREEAPEDNFSDEFSETNEQERPIDVGVHEEKPPEEDRYVPNNDDDQDTPDYSAHAERCQEDDDRYDDDSDADYDAADDAASADQSHDDQSQSQYSGSYQDDATTNDDDDDDKSYVSDESSVKDSKRRAVEGDYDDYDDHQDDDRSAYSRCDQSVDSRASFQSSSEKNASHRSGSRCYDYSDDAFLQQREEEEERELETLEEARRNLAEGEKMHPFLLEHYMALKERKEARRRLSQRVSLVAR
ncbi:unnamed protein product [Cylindrotheca closterium]|uniref:Uncharacterized protein n=1 Tax=Cylindrotheca closterium TaxID=2856 RepID=A0AAD2CF73_9STRA|nr:unnamed protein product [Cylindrotheca closterium]